MHSLHDLCIIEPFHYLSIRDNALQTLFRANAVLEPMHSRPVLEPMHSDYRLIQWRMGMVECILQDIIICPYCTVSSVGDAEAREAIGHYQYFIQYHFPCH